MRILITGGAGFIGSHLVDICLDQTERDVIVMDNFSFGRRSNLPEDPRLEVVEVDITQPGAVMECVEHYEPGLVFHLAAIHHIPTCEQQPELALTTNIQGTLNLVQALGERNCNLVFASSGAVYRPVDEELEEGVTPVEPSDIYGISKIAGENLIRHLQKGGNFKPVIARIFNAIGSRETNAHLVPDIMKQVKRGESEIQLGNLSPRRNYVHVKDIAEGLFLLGQGAQTAAQPVYNVGSHYEYNVEEIFAMVKKVSGKELTIVQNPDRMRPTDRQSQRASLKNIQSLGWTPRRTIEQAIEDAWKFEGELAANQV